MKAKLLLIFLGTLFGAVLILAARPLLTRLVIAQKTGAAGSFESLEDLRRSMLSRDAQDTKQGGSVSLRSIITPHPSDAIIFDLMPHLDVRFQDVPVKTNSCGMRSAEIPVEKPNDVYRIALLGDSFAFGWGVEQPYIFAQVLEDRLNDFTKGSPRVEVLNFGIPGYSTFQEVALAEDRAFDFDPDAVLLYVVDNDFGLPFFVRNVATPNALMDGVHFAKMSWSTKDPEVQEANRQLVNQIDPNLAIRRLSTIAYERAIPLLVAINPNRQSTNVKSKLWVLRRNRLVQTLNLAPYMDARIVTDNIDPKTLTLPTDPHPSALKHRLLGEILTEAFLPLVS